MTFIASRFEGGYGVSAAAVDKVLASGARLLVTCDCGSSDHVSLERVKRAGVDCVVIDHHLVPEEALPVLAFLNPHRPECGFPYKGLASCGLALSIGAALRTWKGAMVLVSHDPEFVTELAPNRVLLMPDGVLDYWSDDLLDLVELA